MSAQHPGELWLNASLAGFFAETVRHVALQQPSEPTDAVQEYLVGVLADYARPESRQRDTLRRPLTFLLHEALQASGMERFERLQSLGDGVLYATGFFRDHLTQRGVALDYVNQLGARAYDGLSSMLRRQSSEPVSADIFRELSDNFRELSELLHAVGEVLQASSAGHGPSATLSLYERWLKTGSQAIGDALCARGVLPIKGPETLQ